MYASAPLPFNLLFNLCSFTVTQQLPVSLRCCMAQTGSIPRAGTNWSLKSPFRRIQQSALRKTQIKGVLIYFAFALSAILLEMLPSSLISGDSYPWWQMFLSLAENDWEFSFWTLLLKGLFHKLESTDRTGSFVSPICLAPQVIDSKWILPVDFCTFLLNYWQCQLVAEHWKIAPRFFMTGQIDGARLCPVWLCTPNWEAKQVKHIQTTSRWKLTTRDRRHHINKKGRMSPTNLCASGNTMLQVRAWSRAKCCLSQMFEQEIEETTSKCFGSSQSRMTMWCCLFWPARTVVQMLGRAPPHAPIAGARSPVPGRAARRAPTICPAKHSQKYPGHGNRTATHEHVWK